jgi:D-xylulose reductase
LLEAVSDLKLHVPSWSGKPRGEHGLESQEHKKFYPEEVAQYLTSIISSSLVWIPSEMDREEIWEQASLRLSERSGRSGMSAMDRSFEIPTRTRPVEINIHEPALTADNLGFKTWAASYLLAKRLIKLDLPTYFKERPFFALELGAGTGLVGVAAAAVLGAKVCVTDLPAIAPNLRRNIEANESVVLLHGGQVASAVLDWTHPESMEWPESGSSPVINDRRILDCFQKQSSYPLILAADSIYAPELPNPFAETVASWLWKDSDARVVVELPLRPGFDSDIEDFRSQMQRVGLVLLEEEEECGLDDWGHDKSEEQLVTCWFSVWGWGCRF